MNDNSLGALNQRLFRPDFPRSSGYDPHWLMDNAMGPHALWLAEWLSQRLELTPGMQVLDLGCGKALSSIFLAKEFSVTVWANVLCEQFGQQNLAHLARREADMLRVDDGRTFGFTRLIAKRSRS
jgi:cyclopropane fatty-acyl-phospholipid synthase-like methyltransferase